MFYVYLQEFNLRGHLLANVQIGRALESEQACLKLLQDRHDKAPEGLHYQFMLLEVGAGRARVAVLDEVKYDN